MSVNSRRKPGRPPRASKVASARFEVRLTSEEYRRYSKAAKQQGLTLAEWWREAADLAYARGSTR